MHYSKQIRVHALSCKQSFTSRIMIAHNSYVYSIPCNKFTKSGLYLVISDCGKYLLADFQQDTQSWQFGCNLPVEKFYIIGRALYYANKKMHPICTPKYSNVTKTLLDNLTA